MKDIKELIYAAVEENAVAFQELAGGILQARAYDAIEALRPEVGASMFGESSHMKGKDDEDEEMEDEEDEDEDEDEKKSKVDEELKGKQHKIDKNKNGKIDAHDFKLLRKEEAEEIDELSQGLLRKASAASYRKSSASHGIASQERQKDRGTSERFASDHENLAAKKLGQANKFRAAADAKVKNEEVENLDERSREELISDIKSLKKTAIRSGVDYPAQNPNKAKTKDLKTFHKTIRSGIKQNYKANNEEAEVDEAVRIRDRVYSSIERGHGDDKTTFQGQMDRAHIAAGAKARRKRTGPGVKGFNSAMKPAKKGDYQPRETGSVRARNEEVEQIDEVDHPKNQADMLAHIMHQIKVTGHPVATDAQFRATHGKDKTKIASLEPGQDKLQYAIAQGGNVKP
jgi:hypothetical protein